MITEDTSAHKGCLGNRFQRTVGEANKDEIAELFKNDLESFSSGFTYNRVQLQSNFTADVATETFPPLKG